MSLGSLPAEPRFHRPAAVPGPSARATSASDLGLDGKTQWAPWALAPGSSETPGTSGSCGGAAPADRDTCPKRGGQSQTHSTHGRPLTLAPFTLTPPHGPPSSPRSGRGSRHAGSRWAPLPHGRFHLPRSPDFTLRAGQAPSSPPSETADRQAAPTWRWWAASPPRPVSAADPALPRPPTCGCSRSAGTGHPPTPALPPPPLQPCRWALHLCRAHGPPRA